MTDTLTELAAGYGIEFTDEETRLLTCPAPKQLLDPIERQRRYLLQTALLPCPCPGCLRAVCRRSACTLPFDATPSIPDGSYACPWCQARLVWHLGLLGGEQWFTLAPGQTVTVPPEEA